jgi:DNA polymerase III subunit epsilon
LRSFTQFWLIPAVSTLCFAFIFVALLVFFSYTLPSESQADLLKFIGNNLLPLVIVLLLILGILIFGLFVIFRSYVEPIRKIGDEMMIMHSANPAYRIDNNTLRDFSRLATLVNESADRYQSLKKSIDERIRLAGESLEEEKNILASIISSLSEAVVVCNPSGTILLFNKRAEELLSFRENGQLPLLPPALIGLGRHISRYLDKGQLDRAFLQLNDKIARAEDNPGSCFAALGPAGHFLKVEIVPILINDNELSGYVLRAYIIALPYSAEPSAGISVCGDSRQPLPLSVAFNQRLALPLIPVKLQQLLSTLQKQMKEEHGLQLHLSMPDEPAWIYGDAGQLTSALAFIFRQLGQGQETAGLDCELARERDYTHLDILWAGHPLPELLLAQWGASLVGAEEEKTPRTLGHILTRHDTEWWSAAHQQQPGRACLRIFFPAADASGERHITSITLADSRPEFYDFDLLHRADNNPDLEEQLLSNLSYTIIDTETTGLDPFSDDIISIGAVRIINGRLLRREVFNILVDPQREIPEKSIKIHGIRPEMLQGQPTIEKVLPRLHQFAGNTVLVGHNVAFDMRMFQVKEYLVPVRFTQPVLDVMFLSAVIHPGHRRHSLEAIAERLGITITGRHTALGDAFAAAEVLLKCIPILARNNILTLKDAIQASKKTKYAKLSY